MKEHRGRIIKATGDSLLLECVSVADAIRRTVAAQQGMAGRNAAVSLARQIGCRVEVHLGDILMDGRVKQQRSLQPGHIR